MKVRTPAALVATLALAMLLVTSSTQQAEARRGWGWIGGGIAAAVILGGIGHHRYYRPYGYGYGYGYGYPSYAYGSGYGGYYGNYYAPRRYYGPGITAITAATAPTAGIAVIGAAGSRASLIGNRATGHRTSGDPPA